MKKVKFRDLEVSMLGFGGMRFPTKDGEIDKEQSYKMLDYAFENGVNYYDTAWFYHEYKSEAFMGEYLSHKQRESFLLATKLPIWECKVQEDILEYFNKQLANLQTDHFDFYLIHAMNKDRLQQMIDLNALDVLTKLRDEGKIKYLGFSFHDDYDTFVKIVDAFDWDFVQIQLNYMDVDHQQGIKGLEILNEKNIPAIIMEPVKGGKLAGFNDEINKMFTDQDTEVSIASWAFRWIASQKGILTILSGMSNMEQVQDNIKTFTGFSAMNKQEMQFMSNVAEAITARQKNLCTNCKYCMPCPYDVEIPGVLRYQNDTAMYGADHTTWLLGNLKKRDVFADKCVSCGECLPKCPQQIDIPGMMEIIASE